MDVVVVAASTAASDLVVADFGEYAGTATFAGNAGGNVVDCYGVVAAVGDCGSGNITLLSLLFSPNPTWVSSFPTPLDRISAIAISGNFVLAVGPMSGGGGAGVVLADISNLLAPSVASTYQGNWLGTPTSVAISGNTGVVGGWLTEVGPMGLSPSVLATFDLSNPSNIQPGLVLDTVGSGLDVPRLAGPLLVDFDGTTIVATNAVPSGGNGAGAYVYLPSAVEPVNGVGGGGAPIAVAEIVEGTGYYVATGQAQSDGAGFFMVQAFVQDGPPPSEYVNGPALQPTLASQATLVRFLNNPADAPWLIAANVTAGGGLFVSVNLLNGSTPTGLGFFEPAPFANVTLASTGAPSFEGVGAPPLGITLGVTALDPLRIRFPFPHFPFPIPPFPIRFR